MHESYPAGLTKDKKSAVRKQAKSVAVQNGEVLIKMRKGMVIYSVCLLFRCFIAGCHYRSARLSGLHGGSK